MSTLNVDKVDPSTGTDLELGTSGDTITVPSGATLTVSGTMNASSITAGTMATARLGSGTASSSTVLYGDQTYKAEPSSVINNIGFYAKLSANSSNLTSNVETKVNANTEVFDIGGDYDNSSNYRFTVPAGGDGQYLFFATVYAYTASADKMEEAYGIFYINGAVDTDVAPYRKLQLTANACRAIPITWTSALDLSAADYVELYGAQTHTTTAAYWNKGSGFGCIRLTDTS